METPYGVNILSGITKRTANYKWLSTLKVKEKARIDVAGPATALTCNKPALTSLRPLSAQILV